VLTATGKTAHLILGRKVAIVFGNRIWLDLVKEVSMDLESIWQQAKAPTPSVTRPIMMIGSGGIVHDAHLPAYAKAGFPVVALVDMNRERAEALAKKFHVPLGSSSIEEAIRFAPKDVVFDVAVPAKAISDILPQLPDGSAVLIQKPMGETLDEAIEILRICRSKGLTAAVNFQLRWSPNMLAARALTNSGALGELHDLEVNVSVHMPWELWSFLSTAPRLEILYHSIHYIDLVRSWFGNPRGVYAKTVKSPRTPDLAATKSVIILDYGNDKRAFIASNHSHDFDPKLQRSYVQWEGITGAMRARMGVNLNYPVGLPDNLDYIVRDGCGWQEAPVNGNWFPDAFMGSMGSLQAYVQGEAKTLPTSVEDAIDTMRTVEAAYLSSERGGVALPPL
jgi:Predicted dehydrogenases and related proteins